MTQHPPSLGDLIATMRATAQADSARPHRPGALEAVVLALILRLCTGLECLFRQWESRPVAAAPRARRIPRFVRFVRAPRVTRFAGRAFLPRALRQPPPPLWLVSLMPARGMRPAATPRPQSRPARAHPPRNAPH